MKLLRALLATGLVCAACTGETRTERTEPSGPEICERDPHGCVTVAPATPIRLGVLIGQESYSGVGMKDGAEFALARRRNVLGHRIELVFDLDPCAREAGALVEQSPIGGPSIVAVIGPDCSQSVPTAAHAFGARGITLISPVVSGADLTTPFPFFLRTAHNDRIQGEAMADFAWERLGARSAATVHVDWYYSKVLERGFSERFAARGGLLHFRRDIPSMPNKQIPPEHRHAIEEIRRSRPDFFYLPLPVIEASAIIRQVRQAERLQDLPLGGGDVLHTADFMNFAGDTAEGVLVTAAAPNLAAWFRRDFATWARQRPGGYGRWPRLARWARGTAFDATNLVLDAVEAVAIEADGTLFIPRTWVRDSVRSTSGYVGASGTLNCDLNGDCNPRVPVVVKEIRHGRMTPVWTWRP